MNPLISVILPVRNGEKYIRDAIGSVRAQTYPHFELIVVDASDDATPKIVAACDDPRIRYFRQTSKGSVNGYNEALDRYVRGTYVTFLHHDDLYAPEKLYEQMRVMQRFADVDCVYNDIEFVNEELQPLRVRGHEDYYHRSDDLLAGMMIGCGISNLGMQTLVKRDFLERFRLRYSLKTPTCCDHAFIFDLIDAGAVFKHVARPLFRYRVHDTNYSGDRDAVDRENLKIYARYRMDELRAVVARTHYSRAEQTILLGRLYYRLGHIEAGDQLFAEALAKEDDAWAAFYLGTGCYRYRGDFEQAQTWLRRGQGWAPYRPEFANNLGCCALQTEGAAAATPYFADALRRMPSYYDAKYNLTHTQNGGPFNPRLTDREIVFGEQTGIVWKNAEQKREESGSLQPAGNV